MLYFLIYEESQSGFFTSHSFIFILPFMKIQKNSLAELPHHMQVTSLLILSQLWISQQLTQVQKPVRHNQFLSYIYTYLYKNTTLK